MTKWSTNCPYCSHQITLPEIKKILNSELIEGYNNLICPYCDKEIEAYIKIDVQLLGIVKI